MTPKEMGELHGILSKAFLESYWKEQDKFAFEKSKDEFIEKMTMLGGRLGNNQDLTPDERREILSKGWVDDKINVTVGHYVEFPEETMRKILVLGLP